MTVTLCVPVYNGEGAIGRCLDSIARACDEGHDVEVIVVDNASSDRTVAVAEAQLRAFRRARVVRNERNLGRIANWNRCLELAEGDWVKLLMVNDTLLPRSLHCLAAEAERDADVVMVCSMHHSWDGGEPPLAAADCAASRRRYARLEALEAVAGGVDPFWALNGALFRRQAIATAGLRFDEALPYLTDKVFMAQLSTHGTTVFLETPTYLFNTGAAGRFHYQALASEGYFREVREFYRFIGERTRPGDAAFVDSRVFASFLSSCYETSVPISPQAVRAAFPGSVLRRGVATGVLAARAAHLDVRPSAWRRAAARTFPGLRKAWRWIRS